MSKQKTITKIPQAVRDTIVGYQKSPFPFIEDMWNIIPQPIKLEKQARFDIYFEDKRYNEITEDFFEPYIEGTHLTWQQFMIIKAVENAAQKKGKLRISVRSGHGIGKTTVMSWILLWYLFNHKEAQIGATAPSHAQMHDALWKECYKQLKRMPSAIQKKFEWQSSYIKMVDSPEDWWL